MDSLEIGTTIHTVALVQELDNCVVGVTSKGKNFSRRDVHLSSPEATITMTVWGLEAEKFDALSRVVAIRGARIKEFQGRKYLTLSGTYVVEPDEPRVVEIKAWAEAVEQNKISEQHLKTKQKEAETTKQKHTIISNDSLLIPTKEIVISSRSHLVSPVFKQD